MKYTVQVQCPHCNSPIKVSYRYTGGTHHDPAEDQIDMNHECSEWTDEEDAEFNRRLDAALQTAYPDNWWPWETGQEDN